MTSYNPPTDTELNTKKPGIFTVFRRLRDMGPAITEGSAGAPKIQTLALDAAVVTLPKVKTGEGFAENAGAVTLLATNVEIATINLGTLAVGDRILVGYKVTVQVDASSTRIHIGVENTGTGVIAVYNDEGELALTNIPPKVGAGEDYSQFGMLRVTTGGTIVLSLHGDSGTVNSTVNAGAGKFHAFVLKAA